ncbi:MAG: alpha/beta hydrolase [Oceanobacter sp.]
MAAHYPNMHEEADQVVMEPDQPADSCLIWLHGLGADGYDFVSLEPYLRSKLGGLDIRCIFPHAPIRPVTFADGAEMRSWYNILEATPKRVIDPVQMLDSVHRIQSLIHTQMASGIPAHRIILAGFSQGGAVAFLTALKEQPGLAGLIALSTYLPEGQGLTPLDAGNMNHSLAVFMGHGSRDNVVPVSLAMDAKEKLERLGLTPEWHSYLMQHEVCYQEVDDIAAFIRKTLN